VNGVFSIAATVSAMALLVSCNGNSGGEGKLAKLQGPAQAFLRPSIRTLQRKLTGCEGVAGSTQTGHPTAFLLQTAAM
jgi:hypothetical protein